MKHATFADHLHQFWLGFGKILEVAPQRRYIYPSRNGFKADADALRKDVRSVQQDMRRALTRYGQ